MTKKVLRAEPGITGYLISQDPVMKQLIENIGLIEIKLSGDYFEALAGAITGQQLSGRVAEIIWNRVVALVGGKPGPESILSADNEKLRETGLSYSKIGYLKNLANAVAGNTLCLDNFNSMEDGEIIGNLTAVKGIGQWTAEMFLIFSLGRQDVFSVGDGGLQRSIKWLYGLGENPKKEQLLTISGKWKPYRTFASLYLWEAINRNLAGTKKL